MIRSEYANRDPLDPNIRETDTNPGLLTRAQLGNLCNWVDYQDAWLFDGAPLRMMLGMFQATQAANYDLFQRWLDNEPQDAADAYNRYARLNGMEQLEVAERREKR